MKPRTLFEIDICGDCANYGDCKEREKFDCSYSLDVWELKRRAEAWYWRTRKHEKSLLQRCQKNNNIKIIS